MMTEASSYANLAVVERRWDGGEQPTFPVLELIGDAIAWFHLEKFPLRSCSP
ncbi:MAG: hypothetical protein R3B96_18165 [Pirellulaceae bacterium]